MDLSELDYDLPRDLIAQRPCDRRDASRLLVVDRATGMLTTDVFRSLPTYLRSGDCLALNETRVIQARLRGHKPSGGAVEVFLLRERGPREWEALVRPSAKVKSGTTITIANAVRATVGEVLPEGRRVVRFDAPDVLRLLEDVGETPLPPYIHRDHPEAADLTRYQTIYAKSPGAVAAPTAGLHFTPEVFDALDRAGVRRAFLTLHVGYGTFKPIQAARLEDHRLDPEEFELPPETAALLNDTRNAGGRVVAVGTTSSRVLETQYREGLYHAGAGLADLFIHPPYHFHAVDALLTNFHLPRSSLLALVFAFAGVGLIRNAYSLAVRERFRFYSYGDAMLIL
jgi:S-adenosylmethionine:tRNA ribosyltransferase-isomerase